MILTHNHFDHAGNVDAFPNAHVYVQHTEVRKFLWARSLPRRLSGSRRRATPTICSS